MTGPAPPSQASRGFPCLGISTLFATVDGGACLNLAVGSSGTVPEECDYVEFVLSSKQADALAPLSPADRAVG